MRILVCCGCTGANEFRRHFAIGHTLAVDIQFAMASFIKLDTPTQSFAQELMSAENPGQWNNWLPDHPSHHFDTVFFISSIGNYDDWKWCFWGRATWEEAEDIPIWFVDNVFESQSNILRFKLAGTGVGPELVQELTVNWPTEPKNVNSNWQRCSSARSVDTFGVGGVLQFDANGTRGDVWAVRDVPGAGGGAFNIIAGKTTTAHWDGITIGPLMLTKHNGDQAAAMAEIQALGHNINLNLANVKQIEWTGDGTKLVVVPHIAYKATELLPKYGAPASDRGYANKFCDVVMSVWGFDGTSFSQDPLHVIRRPDMGYVHPDFGDIQPRVNGYTIFQNFEGFENPAICINSDNTKVWSSYPLVDLTSYDEFFGYWDYLKQYDMVYSLNLATGAIENRRVIWVYHHPSVPPPPPGYYLATHSQVHGYIREIATPWGGFIGWGASGLSSANSLMHDANGALVGNGFLGASPNAIPHEDSVWFQGFVNATIDPQTGGSFDWSRLGPAMDIIEEIEDAYPPLGARSVHGMAHNNQWVPPPP